MSIGRSRTFWRLFGAFALLVLASNALLGFVVVGRVQENEMRQIEESLRTKALVVEEDVRELSGAQVRHLQARVVTLFGQIQTRITLLADDGRVLADTSENPTRMGNHAGRPEIVEARRNGIGTATRFSQSVGQSMMYVARRVEGTSSPVAFVRVARRLTSVQSQLAALRRLVWSVAGGTALAAMLMAFVLARRMARPLQELTAGAERIAAGEYGHKVYGAGADETGTLASAFNTMSQRLAEQFARVEQDRQELRAVLSGMVEGVVAIDAEQRILFANDRAAQLLEFAMPAAVGRKLWEVVRWPSIQEVVRRARDSSEPFREELDWPGLAIKSIAVHAAPLSGQPGRGVVLVLHDTTELRRLERIRQEFVANVSHELKTPLAVIAACVETLLDGAVEDIDNRQSFLEQIEEQASRLHRLILDLLSLTRIESGAEGFEFGAVDLEPVIAECLERHRARAEAKKLTLEARGTGKSGEGQTPAASRDVDPTPAAWADEEAISTILDNLVDNALKYTPEGGRIQVRWGTEDGHVCLEVEDTGIGIPERDLPRIFERFYRVDKARSRELGGTGLGLSIVKHLVQGMKGSVRASSQLDRGTTFHVRLPRAITL